MTYPDAPRPEEGLDPQGFFDRALDEPDPWPIDPAVIEAWVRGRPRRRLIKACGWLGLACAVAGVGDLCRAPAARDEILCWATMGQVEQGHALVERARTRWLRLHGE